MKTLRRFIVPLLLLHAATGAVAAEPRLERTSAPPDKVPAAIREALDPQGYRVLKADGTPLAQIWLRQQLPVSGKKTVEGANYPALSPSMLVGVIEYPAAGKDFRGQPIKPGVYTMRYALLPADGNHMGVAPDRDFLLLSLVGDDPVANSVLRYEELLKLSTKAAGTNHPLALSMVAAPPSVPAAYTDPNDYVVLAAKLDTSGGALPIAIIVKGVSMSF
ncbi:MAG: hypothetical protein ACE14L_12635 [Terriglobales bacterium]